MTGWVNYPICQSRKTVQRWVRKSESEAQERGFLSLQASTHSQRPDSETEAFVSCFQMRGGIFRQDGNDSRRLYFFKKSMMSQ